MTRPSKSTALERLQRALEEIDRLRQLPHDAPEFDRWQRNTRVAIANTFGDVADHVTEFSDISYSPLMFVAGGSPSQFQGPYLRGLQRAEAMLKSMIDEINDFWEEDQQQEEEENAPSHDEPSRQLLNNRVFVAHGRDEGSKSTVARFLEGLGLVPVVLSELPAEGRTIIEKFESQSEVGFAVALFTPDDIGSLSTEVELAPRARQNVIFELGFFIGRLGRGKVCALTRDSIEIPSDYAGVEYITLDDHGAWKMRLFSELCAAGFNIDADRLVNS